MGEIIMILMGVSIALVLGYVAWDVTHPKQHKH
jgi:nitrogen fixation-related uncharacterized protein